MVEASGYEWLIRRAHNCGRDFALGADADIYRAMERAYVWLGKQTGRGKQDAEYEFQSSFAAVRIHVRNALKIGLKQVAYTASQEDVSAIREFESALSFDYYDKQGLDRIIETANAVFRKHGLEGR